MERFTTEEDCKRLGLRPVDQIEHYRHPSVLHVAEFVCTRGHIAASRRVFTSVDDKPAEDERGEGSAE